MENSARLEVGNSSFSAFPGNRHDVIKLDATVPAAMNSNHHGEAKLLANSLVTADEIRKTCEKILSSHLFINAPRMRSLLKFLIDKTVGASPRNINEHLVGVEIFGRNPRSYNTNDDPIARIQIGRLRKKLDIYFATVGASSEVEISIPVGSYRPIIQRRSKPEPKAQKAAPPLTIHPFQCLSHHGMGETFALGLHNELTHQLFKAFGNIILASSSILPSTSESEKFALRNIVRTGPHHALEGSIQIDAEIIRTSVRLLDASTGLLAWSEQFNREIDFAIRLEEELASAICHALKHFFASENKMALENKPGG